MYDLAFYLAFTFLHLCIRCGQGIRHVFRILIVFQHDNIATRQTFFVSDIGAGFCNVFNAFTSNSKKNVTVFKIFWRRYVFKNCMRNTFIKPYAVGGVYFAVADTRNTFFCYLITLYACTSEYINSYFTKFFIFNSVWAKLLYQFCQSTHTPTSISAIIFAISSRRTCSRATISSISALSFTISITSLVSSAST